MNKHSNISWAQFEVCNQDKRIAFENMCRSLFNRYFFNNDAIFHSNPNNPGIEVQPTLNKKTNKQISYQSKYFESKINYTQIEHSANKTIEHYKGQIDELYLYCNKNLTITCNAYLKIKKLLKDNNIALIPVCNESILEQVAAYPTISSLYFHQHSLTPEWFISHNTAGLNFLGPRYNKEFNVETRTNEYLDLFSHSDDAINRINEKKAKAVEQISDEHRHSNYSDLVKKICSEIKSLNEISYSNISECLDWSTYIENKFSTELGLLRAKISELEENLSNSKSEENNDRFSQKG